MFFSHMKCNLQKRKRKNSSNNKLQYISNFNHFMFCQVH